MLLTCVGGEAVGGGGGEAGAAQEAPRGRERTPPEARLAAAIQLHAAAAHLPAHPVRAENRSRENVKLRLICFFLSALQMWKLAVSVSRPLFFFNYYFCC